MSNFTAREARSISMKHKESENQTFSKIRQLCDQHIQNTAKKQEYVRFRVPVFMFGYPLYDATQFYIRLYQSLKKRGFEVYSTEIPMELYITWRKQPASPSSKPTSFQKLSSLRKEISSRNSFPNGNFNQ